MLFPNGKWYVGSGTIGGTKSSGRIILTCAHNFVIISRDKKDIEYFKEAYFCQASNGDGSYQKKYRITKVTLHPNYIEHWTKYKSFGFDLAMAEFDGYTGETIYYPLDAYNGTPTIFVDPRMSIVRKNIKSEEGTMIGYPGEKEEY
jgi:hypothetical protein